MPELTHLANRGEALEGLRLIKEAIIRDASQDFDVAAKMENLARVNELKAILLGDE